MEVITVRVPQYLRNYNHETFTFYCSLPYISMYVCMYLCTVSVTIAGLIIRKLTLHTYIQQQSKIILINFTAEHYSSMAKYYYEIKFSLADCARILGHTTKEFSKIKIQ